MTTPSMPVRRTRPAVALCTTAALLLGGLSLIPRAAHAAPADSVRMPAPLAGTAPDAPRLGPVPDAQAVTVRLTLPLRNRVQLENLIVRQADPTDPQYKHYFTPDQFAQEFGPTEADFDALLSFARSQGLTVVGQAKSRTLLSVQGTAAQVGAAFGVTLSRYARPDGTEFFSADSGPLLPQGLAERGAQVFGLNDFAKPVPQIIKAPLPRQAPGPVTTGGVRTGGRATPDAGYFSPGPGNGPNGGLSPSDVNGYYGDVSVGTYNGAGQSVALLEFDTFNNADTNQYINKFNVGWNTHLLRERVDGYQEPPYDGSDDGQGEVTLDIDMALIFAPQINNIYVYEGSDWLELESRIADDDLVSALGISWAFQENPSDPSYSQSESAYFAQMAVEGMSVFAASGDTGAYNDLGKHVEGPDIVVQDPASQPWVTGAGGTTINYSHSFLADWKLTDEVAWSKGGGGISKIWDLPPFQTALLGATGDSQLSQTMRNVPDVAANADPNSAPYAIYFDGAWKLYGGTSAAAPLWAGYVARYNQYMAQNGYNPAGNVNALLYGDYANSFLYNNSVLKDITSGNNGVFYAFGGGYDNATGLGSMQHDWVVNNQTATVTALSAPGSGLFGQPLTFTATVTPYAPSPGNNVYGTVGFQNSGAQFDDVVCSNGQATLTYNALPLGNDSVTAAFTGDGTNAGPTAYGSSRSPAKMVTITPGFTSPAFSVSPPNPTVGRQFTVTATVSPSAPSTLTPTGKVLFTDATGRTLGEYNLSNGISYINLTENAVGAYTVKGSYISNTGYLDTTIPAITVTVGLNTTSTALSDPASATVGQSVTLKAVVSGNAGPTGQVTFYDGTTSLGMASLSAGAATLPVTFTAGGSHALKAVYGGDGANSPSTGTGSLSVKPATSATALSVSAPSLLTGQSEILTATVSGYGTPTGSVAFTDGGTTLGTAALSGGFAKLTVSFTTAGTHMVKAGYGGDAANAPSSNTASIAVGQNTTIAADVSLQGVQPGSLAQPLVCTLTPTGTTAGGVTTQTITPAAGDGSFTLSGVPAGTYTLGVKGGKWLRRDVPIDTTGGSVTGLSVPLLGGDVSGHNQVSLADLAALRAAYGSHGPSASGPASPGWNPQADLTCDGQVSLADLAILRSNYGKRGDR